MKVKHHYLNNRKFYKLLVEYDEDGYVGDELAYFFVLLALNIKNSNNYIAYDYDGMVEDAVECCIRYVHNFDVSHKSKNPFGYFSLAVTNSYKRRITKEAKNQEGMQKYQDMNKFVRFAYSLNDVG